jgi:large repetitive protein
MFTSNCGKSRQTRPFARRPAGRAAFLEALESRVLLSGTVAVTVVGKNLFITGDDQSNNILITGSNGAYEITSADATVVTGGSVTGITGKITIKLNAGNDSVSFDTATFGSTLTRAASPVSIYGGAGDNSVALTDTTIVGALTVTNAGGFNNFSTSGDVLVTGAVSIKNGAGGTSFFAAGFVAGSNVTITAGAQTTVSVATFSSISIAGNLSITNGNGDTNTSLSDCRIGGKTTIANGVGANEVVVVSGCVLGKALNITTNGENTTQVAGTTIGGDLTITTNATTGAQAMVNVVGSVVIGNVNCTVGNAKNAASLFSHTGVVFNSSSFHKNFTFSAAAQTNNLSVAAVQLAGAAKVAYGAGNNTATITDVAIGGNVTFTSAGAGFDDLTMNGAIGGNLSVTSGNNATAGDVLTVSALTVGGNLTAKTGAGADTITGDAIVVHGKTDLRTGDGDDVLHIDDCTFVGSLSLLGGNGNSQILIEQSGDADGPLTSFLAPVSLKLGNGNNTVSVGEASVDGRKALFLGPLTLVGGTGTNHLTIANLALVQFPTLKGFTLI